MRPKFGDIVSVDSKNLVKIDADNYTHFKYTGATVVSDNGVRCATFTDNQGQVYMQPWLVAGRFRRKGELNINSKLKSEQVREMVRSFVLNGANVSDLALKYGITEDYCKNIVTGNAWRHITINYIWQLRNGNTAPPVVVKNKTKTGHKLSGTLIPFIRKDSSLNKMTVKALAVKYCVSERQIQRILKGEAWK